MIAHEELNYLRIMLKLFVLIVDGRRINKPKGKIAQCKYQIIFNNYVNNVNNRPQKGSNYKMLWDQALFAILEDF
jgi:hypothetical protein